MFAVVFTGTYDNTEQIRYHDTLEEALAKSPTGAKIYKLISVTN